MAAPLPRCAHAIVGGSGTAAIEFPEALDDPRVRVLAPPTVVETPFGPSPALQRISVVGEDGTAREALVAQLEAWRHDAGRDAVSLALFWVLREAGVRRIVAQVGAASITQNFRPRDMVLPTDVIDFTPQVGGRLEPGTMMVMHRPFCPDIRDALWGRAALLAADKATRAFDRGVIAVTAGARFETAAEVVAFARLGADLVSQASSPEVYLAREIGACYAPIAAVISYAEGVRPSWDYELLEEIVHDDARALGRLLLDTLLDIPETPRCACRSYRKQAPAPATRAAAQPAGTPSA